LVIVLQSYMRWPWYMERTLAKELRLLGIDHCDVLLLGWYNVLPPKKIVDRVEQMRAKGMFRHVAISSHNRPTFVELAKDPRYGILHIRYNAAHTGAERDVFPNLPPRIVPASWLTRPRAGARCSRHRTPPRAKRPCAGATPTASCSAIPISTCA
jgi:hypothetical protein